MRAKFLAGEKDQELIVWKRNRHLIWIFALVSSIFTYISVSKYYQVKLTRLQQNLTECRKSK